MRKRIRMGTWSATQKMRFRRKHRVGVNEHLRRPARKPSARKSIPIPDYDRSEPSLTIRPHRRARKTSHKRRIRRAPALQGAALPEGVTLMASQASHCKSVHHRRRHTALSGTFAGMEGRRPHRRRRRSALRGAPVFAGRRHRRRHRRTFMGLGLEPRSPTGILMHVGALIGGLVAGTMLQHRLPASPLVKSLGTAAAGGFGVMKTGNPLLRDFALGVTVSGVYPLLRKPLGMLPLVGARDETEEALCKIPPGAMHGDDELLGLVEDDLMGLPAVAGDDMEGDDEMLGLPAVAGEHLSPADL